MTFRDFATYFMFVPSANQWRVPHQFSSCSMTFCGKLGCSMFVSPCCCHSSPMIFPHILFAPRGDRPLVGRSLHEGSTAPLGISTCDEIGQGNRELTRSTQICMAFKLQNFDPNFAFFCWATHHITIFLCVHSLVPGPIDARLLIEATKILRFQQFFTIGPFGSRSLCAKSNSAPSSGPSLDIHGGCLYVLHRRTCKLWEKWWKTGKPYPLEDWDENSNLTSGGGTRMRGYSK